MWLTTAMENEYPASLRVLAFDGLQKPDPKITVIPRLHTPAVIKKSDRGILASQVHRVVGLDHRDPGAGAFFKLHAFDRDDAGRRFDIGERDAGGAGNNGR